MHRGVICSAKALPLLDYRYICSVKNSVLKINIYMRTKLFIVLAAMCSLMLVSCEKNGLNGKDRSGVIDGREYVDLGLPSGTLWATCNVGANKPEEAGDYFAWGETTTKSVYDWSNYKYGKENQLTKYCSISAKGKDGFTDKKKELESSDDAATANLGSKWRTPTKQEMDELNDYTVATWISINGVYGRLFYGDNGNTMFIPAAGYYRGDKLYASNSLGICWTSTIFYENNSSTLNLNYSYCDASSSTDRCYGVNIRPVRK